MTAPTLDTPQDDVTVPIGTATTIDVRGNFSETLAGKQLWFNNVDKTYITIPEWTGTTGDEVHFTFIPGPDPVPAKTGILFSYDTSTTGLRLVLGNNYKLRLNYTSAGNTIAVVWTDEVITANKTYTGYFKPTAGGAELWMEIAGVSTKVAQNTTDAPDLAFWKLSYIGALGDGVTLTGSFNGVIKNVTMGTTREYLINDGAGAQITDTDADGGDSYGTQFNTAAKDWETVA